MYICVRSIYEQTNKQPPAGFCETSMNFYQTTQYDMIQDSIDIYRYILLVSVLEQRGCDIDTSNIEH